MQTTYQEKTASRERPAFCPGKSLGPQEISLWARSLAQIMQCGIPVERGLAELEANPDNPRLGRLITHLLLDLELGGTFSEALAELPAVFPPPFVRLVRQGEAAGAADLNLHRAADLLVATDSLLDSAKAQMSYPIVVLSIANLTIVALLWWVIPQFREIFIGMRIDLPHGTRLLLDFSGMLEDWWWVVLPSLFGLPFAIRFLGARTIGRMVATLALIRFTRTLGTLLSAGVPLSQALGATPAGEIHRGTIHTWDPESDREAGPTAEKLPTDVSESSAAERRGRCFLKVAEELEGDWNISAQRLRRIIEPGVIIFLSLVIGAIVLSVFMPMLRLCSCVE